MEDSDNQDRLSVIPWILLLIIVVLGFFFYQSRQDARMKADEKQKQMAREKDAEQKRMEEKAKKTITIELDSQNNSEQKGSAQLVEEDGKVLVTLSLTGGNFTAPQPAHFHEGDCEGPGKIVYPLSNVQNGKSQTSLDTTLEKMNGETPLVVNVHKSESELKIYTACGVLE